MAHPEAEREEEGEEGSRSMIARNRIRLDQQQITSSQRRPQFEFYFNRHFRSYSTLLSFTIPSTSSPTVSPTLHTRLARCEADSLFRFVRGRSRSRSAGTSSGSCGIRIASSIKLRLRFLPTCDMPIGDEHTEPISYLRRCPLFSSLVQLPVDRCTQTPTRLSADPRPASLGLYAGTELDELVPPISGLGGLPLCSQPSVAPYLRWAQIG